jgi:hypothetical protein
MDFHARHLSEFKRSEIGRWEGKPLVSWSASVGHKLALASNHLPVTGRHTREELFKMGADSSLNTLDLCVAIFAWGGMRTDHGRRILGSTAWLDIAELLRSNKINHFEGFQEFFALRKAGKLPGCGPAYYTKVLFFLPLDGRRGIIMDQWTARSINLLLGHHLVTLIPAGKNFRVSPDNDLAVYASFCAAVGHLTNLVGGTLQTTEMRLFSQGGKRMGKWREYVKSAG